MLISNDSTSIVQVQNKGNLSAASVNNSGQFLTGNGVSDTGSNIVNVTGTFTNNGTFNASGSSTPDNIGVTFTNNSSATARYTIRDVPLLQNTLAANAQ